MAARQVSFGIALLALAAACGSDDDAESGQGGAGGSAASAGKTGSGGKSGSSGGGSGGAAASGGTAASTGGTSTGGAPAGGAGGASGAGASGGTGGSSGSSGGSTGTGGSAGTPGACGAITTFADGLNPAREIHVATNGNDNNAGTAASPVLTIEQGIQLATPGTAVRIHAGTYGGGAFVSGLAGTAAAPIWIGGVQGEARPIIDGGADSMHLVRPRYVVIHDLEIRNQSANGMNVDDGDDRANGDAARFVVFRNLFVHDIGSGGNQDCLKLSGLNDYFVLDSRFERCGGGGSGSAVDHVGCHQGLLARNVLDDLQGNGIQSKGGSQDVEIRWNLIRNAGERSVNMGGSTGTAFFRPPLSTGAPNFEARNIRVIANVFVGGVVPIAFVGCVDCLAANNTIVDPDNWILRILQETVSDTTYEFLPASNGRFVNNIVYFSRAGISTYVNVGANTAPDTFVFQNNLWYAHDNAGQSTPNLPASESAGIYGQDPGFLAAASGDYSISGTGPAAGAGLSLSEVTGDFGGRCYLDPPSIGAFER